MPTVASAPTEASFLDLTRRWLSCACCVELDAWSDVVDVLLDMSRDMIPVTNVSLLKVI